MSAKLLFFLAFVNYCNFTTAKTELMFEQDSGIATRSVLQEYPLRNQLHHSNSNYAEAAESHGKSISDQFLGLFNMLTHGTADAANSTNDNYTILLNMLTSILGKDNFLFKNDTIKNVVLVFINILSQLLPVVQSFIPSLFLNK